jgi:hypothetical protein
MISLAALAATRAMAADDTGSRTFRSWLPWGEIRVGGEESRVVGSGKLIRQARDLQDFSTLKVEGPLDVVLRQGSAVHATVHADDNIVEFVESTVHDGQLSLGIRRDSSFRTRNRILVTLELVRLEGLDVLGAGDVNGAQLASRRLDIAVRGSGNLRIELLQAEAVDARIRGSGNLFLAGSAARQAFLIEGSGDLTADELAGRDVSVRVVGSGNARVRASDTLAVEIVGSGRVRYRGEPVLSRSGMGSGSVDRL